MRLAKKMLLTLFVVALPASLAAQSSVVSGGGSSGGGSGSVNSVAATVPSFMSVTGSPITDTGTLAFAFGSQAANLVFVSPDGTSGAPTFRALVSADIPSLAASKITGTAVVTADSRLSDARTPTAHASTHAAAGSDPLTLTEAQITGLSSDLSARLLAASNLSDVASASSARTNLGLGTLATQSGTFSGTSSGTNTGDQIVPANTTSTASQWFSAYNSSTGVFTKSQPAFSDISGSLSHAQLPALVSGDIPNNAANTSGNAGTATALAANGSNCSSGSATSGVDASGNAENCAALAITKAAAATKFLASYDSTTGTFTNVQPAFTDVSGSLAHSQLPTLLSGDIPNNAANTTGSAATLTTARTINGDSFDGSGNIQNTLASSDFANQGTTTTLFHGNASGNPAFGSVVNADIAANTIDVTTKLTGTLLAAQEPARTGDTTNSAGSLATTTKQLHLTETAITFASSPYTVVSADSVITCDASSGAVVINLPAASGSGRYITIKKIDSSSNACTPTRAGSDLIDGATSYGLTTQYAASNVIDTLSGVWSRGHVNQLGGDLSGVSTNAVLASVGGGAGSCTNCSVTFDAKGRETAYSSGSGGSTPTGTGARTVTSGVEDAAATAYTSNATASTIASRDSNANTRANNYIDGYTTTATAAGTTTLTVASTKLQFFTGSTTQTVALPVASTLVAGQEFYFENRSTGTVTINSSGANLVLSMPTNTVARIWCVLTSGTTAASWSSTPIARTDVAQTFTGVQSFSSSPTSPGSGSSPGERYGSGATASGNFATSIGNGATASGQSDVVIGYGASATGTNEIAIGTSANAGSNTPSIALGTSAATTAANQIVIGSNGSGARITDVYIGSGVTSTTASSSNLTINASGGSGTDNAGASTGIAGGKGTGTGAGGDVELRVALAGSTGSSLNALNNKLRMSGTSGHFEITGTAPALSSCGTSPSIVGNDNVMMVTIGTGVVTSCTVTFAKTWGNAPVCTSSDATNILTIEPSTTTTVLTLTSTTTMGTDKINVLCGGWY